jgi:hypothetical protein
MQRNIPTTRIIMIGNHMYTIHDDLEFCIAETSLRMSMRAARDTLSPRSVLACLAASCRAYTPGIGLPEFAL